MNAVATTAARSMDPATGPTAGRFRAWSDTLLFAAFGVLIFLVGRWGLHMWRLGFEAAPVLADFEAEAGGPIANADWMYHPGARAVFCPHPDALVSTSPIGRFIDAEAMYWPTIMVNMAGTVVATGLLTLIGISNVKQPVRRWSIFVGLTVLTIAIVPIVVHHDTINILSWVTE